MFLSSLILSALLACDSQSVDTLAAAPADVIADSTRPDATGPSVLIITLDTTRADRLSPYGYRAADTPAYAKLASEGTVFTRAYSTAPLTIPSHSTIFTGKAPPSHGVRDNGDFLLGEEQVTLAERLHDAGWNTLAFTSAFPTQRRWGFDQGFDDYHDPLQGLPTQLDWRDERRAGEVIDDALDTMPDYSGPTFAWVHLFDAHWPYEPPEPFKTQHQGRPYDGEIAYASYEVARLLEWWDAHHPDSVVIITADHGEGMGDGGEQTHGFLLHDGTIRVPMIVRGPGFEPGTRIDDAVGHVDIVPTVLDIAGLQPHEGLQGRDLRKGGSDRMYSEALTGQFNLGLAPLYAYTEQDGRYAEGAWGGWYPAEGDHIPVDYEGEQDPAEQLEALALFRAQLDEVVAPSATLGAEEFEQLMALGYLGGDTIAAEGDIDPRDVIDVVPLSWHARQAMAKRRFKVAEKMINELDERMPDAYGVLQLRGQLLRAQGRLPAAAEIFADLYLRSPSSTLAMQLGSIAATQGRWHDAADWFEEAHELQPASPEAMAGMVRAAKAMGQNERAGELADRFLLLYPDHAELALIRAEMAILDGRYEEALNDGDAALQQMPNSPWALTLTGQALWELGRADASIVRLQDAVRVDPYNIPVRLRLAENLLEVGRNAEAYRLLAPTHRVAPNHPEITRLHDEAKAALDAERGYRR